MLCGVQLGAQALDMRVDGPGIAIVFGTPEAVQQMFTGKDPSLVLQQQLQDIGWRELAVIAYLAFLSTLLGYGLWTRLLQRYAASTVAPLSLLVPVIGLLSAMLLLGESPTGMQWLGTLGVLLGMVVNQFGGRWARRR